MEKFIIELKDLSKRNFLLELLSQLDFIEFDIKEEEIDQAEKEDDYDFFQSAGLFSSRDIDAHQLRKQAWRISN